MSMKKTKSRFLNLLKIAIPLICFSIFLWNCQDEKDFEFDIVNHNTVTSSKGYHVDFAKGKKIPKKIISFIDFKTKGTKLIEFNTKQQLLRLANNSVNRTDAFGEVDETESVVVSYPNETRYTFNIVASEVNVNEVVNLIVIDTGTSIEEYFIRYQFDDILTMKTLPRGAIDMTDFSGKVFYYDNSGNLTGEYTLLNGKTTEVIGYGTPSPDCPLDDDDPIDPGDSSGSGTGSGGQAGGGNQAGDGTGPGNGDGEGDSNSGSGGELVDPDTCGLEYSYELCCPGGTTQPHGPGTGVQGEGCDCNNYYGPGNLNTLTVTNTCTGETWSRTDDTLINPCPPTDGVIIDLAFIAFIDELNDTQKLWFLDSHNRLETSLIREFLRDNIGVDGLYEEKTIVLAKYSIDLFSQYDSTNFPGINDGLNFGWWRDKNFIQNHSTFLFPPKFDGDVAEQPNAKEILLFALFPQAALIHMDNANKALNKSIELAQNNTFQQTVIKALNNGKGDAFRHAYWNALGTTLINKDIVKLFTDAHEWNKSGLDVDMDFFNNHVGREIGVPYFFTFPQDDVIINLILNALSGGDLRYISPTSTEGGIISSSVIIPTNQ